jgi:hypothetical protein
MKKALKIIKNDEGKIEGVLVIDANELYPNTVDEFYHFKYELAVVGDNFRYIDPIELAREHGLTNSINIVEAAAEVMITDESYFDFVMDRLSHYRDYGFVSGFIKVIMDYITDRGNSVNEYYYENNRLLRQPKQSINGGE